MPILEAPYHLPVFTNQYVTVLKIFIPPGRNTGYHTHTEDSVSVNIVTADRTNQNFGSSEVSPVAPGQRGRATYTAYSTEGPRTHRATNVGQTPFHNVSFIFRSRESGQFTPSLRADAPGYVEIMDNERVRGWRLVLEPGQSAAPIAQTAPAEIRRLKKPRVPARSVSTASPARRTARGITSPKVWPPAWQSDGSRRRP